MTSLDLDAVIGRLGYDDGEGLVRVGDTLDPLPAARRHAWTAARERLGVYAAYFEGREPLVYFAGLSTPSDQEIEREIATLHQRTWNQSRAQLLVVVLPNEVRILDGRSAFGTRAEMLVADGLDDSQLEPFTREGLLRGHTETSTVDPRHKPVVLQLREDLRPTRVKLIRSGLPRDAADQLLARCLFAQYLDARSLLPAGSLCDRPRFIDSLNESLADTYNLFDALRARFNGDTFTVTDEEREAARPEHLHVVASFLAGTAGTGQLTLVDRYDFRVIPADVLGGVYEEFVRDEQHRNAAYYTPGHLVDAALDEAMPPTTDLTSARVLDPACGSGLFLARAYERLLDHFEESLGRPLTANEMAEVLSKQVFGCDLMEDALRVAALSCYLVLLDRLADDDDLSPWHFPQMLGGNLRQGDFFDLTEHFPGPYDVITSNPPWKKATESAQAYLTDQSRPAGSKLTLAQAFFWASLDRLSNEGRVALLMPAASLYKQRPSERAFQSQALGEAGLDVIIDFSAFRHALFADATAPCALYVVRGSAHDSREHVTFSAPKPGPVSAATGRIAIDADRIARVPRRELQTRPGLLRRLVFGDMRDARFVDRVCYRQPLVRDLKRAGKEGCWVMGLGYQVGGGDENDLPRIREIPSVGPDNIAPFGVAAQAPIDAHSFHRPRIAALYEGPRVLLARAVDPKGFVRAAYLDKPASYSETIIGLVPPPGREADALALCAFLNSRLARYLLFMTASSWGIERPQLKQQDVGALPVPFLSDAETRSTLAGLADAASPANAEDAIRAIDACLAQFLQLNTDELALINDRLDVQLAAFSDSRSGAAYDSPSGEEVGVYRTTLERTLSAALATETVVHLERTSEDIIVTIGLGTAPPVSIVGENALGWIAVPSGTLLLRRPQRTYGHDWCQLRKFNERKDVTAAAALHDSDEIVSEMLRAATRHELAGRSRD